MAKKILEPQMLVGEAGLSEMLGWHIAKVHTYNKRGKFEVPAFMVGNRPAWTPEQARRIAREYKGKVAE